MSEFKQIKASAGSGKTYTLTSTFLSLLAGSYGASWSRSPAGCTVTEDESYGWQEILAITFTNKAATEMRERLLLRLKSLALAPAQKSAKESFWKSARARQAVDMLIRSYGSLNIRTIDSLLHLMVRLSALDFDISPDFEPRFSDGEITGPLFDAIAESARTDEELGAMFCRACRQMLRSEKFKGFLAGERIRDRVISMVSLMLEADDWSVYDLSSAEEAEEHFQKILQGIENEARELCLLLEKEKLSAAKHFTNALIKCTECGGYASNLPLTSKMLQKESVDECLLKASKGQASLKLHALYDSLKDDIQYICILIGARRLMPFVELAQAVYSRLEDEERRMGIIAASQMARLAIRAADDSEGVNELFCRLGARVRHMLIDEFQDTSRDQWLALLPLAEEALAKNGSVTIVGDVKQAIYGWRGGDAALFDELVHKGSPLLSLVEKPELETLPYNWRSRKNIVAWNNALFSPLGNKDAAKQMLTPLAEGDEELLNAQASLLCEAFDRTAQSAEKCRTGGYVQLHRLEKGNEDEMLSTLLPDMVENLSQSHSLGDICILTRDNAQATKASMWLMARHIPVVTQGSLLLAEQPVIAGLISLLRFLNDAYDDIAFYSALLCKELLPPLPHKGGFLTETDMLDWAAQRPMKRSMAAQFAQDFPEAWEAVFSPLHDNAGLLTPYDAVMEIIERWHVMERCPKAEGFLRRFLELLFCAEEAGTSDLSGFLDLWDESGSLEKAPLPESMEAVRIMTMHKSKGLEFDVVILPWLNFSLGRANDDKAMFWNSRGVGLIAPLCKEMGRPWIKNRMDTARESLHLIYVAMTRAVSELYCFLPDASYGQVSLMLNTLIERRIDELKEKDGALYWGEPLKPSEKDTVKAQALVQEKDITAKDETEDAMAGKSPAEGDEQKWRPMGWLPRLRIFKNDLQELTFSAKRRGTLIHHCLEYLQISGAGKDFALRDAAIAAERGIESFPLPVPDREKMQKEVESCLAWYAELPETAHWLAYGTPEHSLLDGEGRQFRVDLLVDDGRELIAVEYKTGTSGELPAREHKKQLLNYLELLKKATGQRARGVLIYLDRREIFEVLPGEIHE